MKNLLLLMVIACIGTGIQAQELKTIKLNKPDTKRGLSFMEALTKRHSTREFANRPV